MAWRAEQGATEGSEDVRVTFSPLLLTGLVRSRLASLPAPLQAQTQDSSLYIYTILFVLLLSGTFPCISIDISSSTGIILPVVVVDIIR